MSLSVCALEFIFYLCFEKSIEQTTFVNGSYLPLNISTYGLNRTISILRQS